MTKGIRSFTKSTFNAMLPQLPEMGYTQFRAEVIAQTMMAFDIKPTAAATHFNKALQDARVAAPELLAGYGRAPEKNNGGRKKKADAVVDAAVAV